MQGAAPPAAQVTMPVSALRQRIRWLLIFLIAALVLSGLTAFPLVWEASLLNQLAAAGQVARWWPAMAAWIARIAMGL